MNNGASSASLSNVPNALSRWTEETRVLEADSMHDAVTGMYEGKKRELKLFLNFFFYLIFVSVDLSHVLMDYIFRLSTGTLKLVHRICFCDNVQYFSLIHMCFPNSREAGTDGGVGEIPRC